MPLEGGDEFAACQIPQFECFVHSCPTAPCGHQAEKATEVDHSCECPLKVRMSLPLATSHNLSVLSQLPDSALWPSAEKATEVTAFANVR